MPIFLLTESLHDRFNEQKPIKRGGGTKKLPKDQLLRSHRCPPRLCPPPHRPPAGPAGPPGPRALGHAPHRSHLLGIQETIGSGHEVAARRPQLGGRRHSTPRAAGDKPGLWLGRGPSPSSAAGAPTQLRDKDRKDRLPTTVHRRCCSRQWGSPGLAAASHATGTRPCLWSSWSLRQEPGVSSSA